VFIEKLFDCQRQIILEFFDSTNQSFGCAQEQNQQINKSILRLRSGTKSTNQQINPSAALRNKINKSTNQKFYKCS
jgi:hypothetical protein